MHLPPKEEIACLLDHSSNHDKTLTDGLNAKRMGTGWGGTQPKMHPSRDLPANCVGNHNAKLEEGGTQFMVFTDEVEDVGRDGPDELSPDDQVK